MGEQVDVIRISVVREERVTEVECVLETEGERFVGVGRARRHPADEPHPAIGYQLALSRALEALSRSLAEAAKEKLDKLFK